MAANSCELTADEKEASERRLAEIAFIESAYSTDEAYVVSPEQGVREGVCCSVIRRVHLPVTSCSISSVEDDDDSNNNANAVKVELCLDMPEAYPIQEDAGLTVKGSLLSSPSNPPFIRKAALSAIPQLLDACQQSASEIAESGGGEAVFSVLSRAEEFVDSDWGSILEEHRNGALINGKSVFSNDKSLGGQQQHNIDACILGRRIIYSHHIIANSKRRDIADLTSQYKLGGYMKIGWPGVILIEGNESDCQTFVDEIKRWRWQQLQVRGEEQTKIPEGHDNLDSHRKLPLKFEELGENDMSRFANNCREAGLESLFLTCMKINDHRTNDVDCTIQNDEGDNDSSNYGVLVHVDHMNDGKRYRKWLRKTCQSQGCTLMVKQFSSSDDSNNNGRPTIYVGIFGNKENTKKVMKLWRTSRVDVDSKNKPCLERMMSVVEEGALKNIPGDSALDGENELSCTFEELACLFAKCDAEWASNLRNRHL